MRITINEETARRAKEASSFYDYKAGSATADYIAACEEVENMIETIEEKYQYQIIGLVDRYTTKYGNWINAHNSNSASCPSWFISGPANYDMKKFNKQQTRESNLWAEFDEIQALKAKILNFTPKFDKEDQTTKTKMELEKMQKTIEQMKAINAHYRKYNNLDTFEGISEKTKASIIEGLKTSWRSNPKPFEDFQLTSIRGKIKTLEENLTKLTAPKEESKETEKNGIKIIENKEIDRIQLFFDGIPSQEIRNELKSKGFRWSPISKAWQRQLTQNAKYDVKNLSFIK
jgi:hypothetical protein